MPGINQPSRHFIPWLLLFLFILVGVFFAYRAWLDWSHPLVVVEWSTATELETVGFNLYRSNSPDGELEKINLDMIPASTDSLQGGDYSFEDNRVQHGRLYYYVLEDIATSGASTRHGPVEVEAKGEIGLNAILTILCLGAAGLVLVVLPGRPTQAAGN